MELTVATANIDSPEWAELFIQSVRKMTCSKHEIVVIDNGSIDCNLKWLREQRDIRLVELPENFGHGAAMDLATRIALGKYMCFLDVDAHVQRIGWDTDLIALYRSDPAIRLIGCMGPEHKPLHPPLFFYEPRFIREHGISFRYFPGISTDTAQKAYWDVLSLGFKVHRLEKCQKIYDSIGDEIDICRRPSVFHMWYGTRFCENNVNRIKLELDGYSLGEHLRNKKALFDEPLVKAILK